VSDGQFVSDGLVLAGKDAAWVKAQLKEQGYSSVKQVFLAELVDGSLEVVPFATSAKAAKRGAPQPTDPKALDGATDR